MTTFDPEPLDATAWRAAVDGLADHSLPQSWNYGAAKAASGPWRVERGVLRGPDGAVTGAAQVLLRDLPAGLRGGLAWISRGPLWRGKGGEAAAERLEAALAAMTEHYARRRGYYLRMAPPAPPGLARGSDVRQAGAAGWASARLDLTRPEAALRAGLAQKWRNAANKAERAGIAVTATAVMDGGGAVFGRFLADYAAFMQERGFATTVSPALLTALAERSGGAEGLTLLAAERDGEALGWTLVARYGATAEYLAGVVNPAGRDAGAGQLLLWRAVVAMREAGLRCFDVGGLDPDLTPEGIRRFKEGLGAVAYRLMDEVEALPAGPLAGATGRLVRWRVGMARAALAG